MTKPFDHEDYRIPGTNAFNLSKWLRENQPAPPPRFAVGDLVVLIVPTEIVRVYEDCDGTPLYELSPGGRGWSEYSLLPGAVEYDDMDNPIKFVKALAARFDTDEPEDE